MTQTQQQIQIQLSKQHANDIWNRVLFSLEILEFARQEIANFPNYYDLDNILADLPPGPLRTETETRLRSGDLVESDYGVQTQVRALKRGLQNKEANIEADMLWLAKDFLAWLGGRKSLPWSRVDDYSLAILRGIGGASYEEMRNLLPPELEPENEQVSQDAMLKTMEILAASTHLTDKKEEEFKKRKNPIAEQTRHERGRVEDGIERVRTHWKKANDKLWFNNELLPKLGITPENVNPRVSFTEENVPYKTADEPCTSEYNNPAKFASIKEKQAESLGDYEKRDNYKIANDYWDFCTGQALEIITDDIFGYIRQRDEELQDDAKFALFNAEIKMQLSETILVKAYRVQFRRLVNKQPLVEFETFFKSHGKTLLSQLKLSKELAEKLKKTAQKGFYLVTELVSTNPPCHLFDFAEPGDTFDPEEYEAATGCPNKGVVKFTVIRGVLSGDQCLRKPIVFVEHTVFAAEESLSEKESQTDLNCQERSPCTPI